MRPVDRVPRMSVRNCHDESVSIAEPTPTKPPPSRKYSSKAAWLAAVSGLAMPVPRNTTAPYCSRFAAVNCAPTSAGAGAVTVKPPLAAAAWIAATPAVDTSSWALVTTSTL